MLIVAHSILLGGHSESEPNRVCGHALDTIHTFHILIHTKGTFFYSQSTYCCVFGGGWRKPESPDKTHMNRDSACLQTHGQDQTGDPIKIHAGNITQG